MKKELEAFVVECQTYIKEFQKKANYTQQQKDYFDVIQSLIKTLTKHQKKQKFDRQFVEVTIPAYEEGLTFSISGPESTGYHQHPCDEVEFKKGIYSRILLLNNASSGEYSVTIHNNHFKMLGKKSFVKKAGTQVVLRIRAENLSKKYEEVHLDMNVHMKEVHSLTIISSSNKEVKRMDNLNLLKGKSVNFKLDRSNPSDTYKVVVKGLSYDDKLLTKTDFGQITEGKFLTITVANLNAPAPSSKNHYDFKVNAEFEVKTISIVEKGNSKNEIASASYLALKSDTNLLNHSTEGPIEGVFYLLEVQGVDDKDVIYFDIPSLTSSSKVNVNVAIVADLVKKLDWDKDVKEVIEKLYNDEWISHGRKYFNRKAKAYLNSNGSSSFGDMLNLGLAGTLLYSGMAPFSAFTLISLNILKKALNDAVRAEKEMQLNRIEDSVDKIFDAQMRDFREGKSIKVVSEIKKGLYKKYGGIFMTTAEIRDCIKSNNTQIIHSSKIEKTIDDCFKK